MLESPRGPAPFCFLESKCRRVWGRYPCVSLSLNRPFLPLLQMSESETLISMVNRMVESSSPRAQLFMQVRPLPGSMVPVSTISAACAWSSQLIWDGACSTQPTHLPGLISQAQPGLPPLIPPCFLHFSHSWGNPRPISQTIKMASTNISCLPGITTLPLMSRTSILDLVSSPQTLLGSRACGAIQCQRCEECAVVTGCVIKGREHVLYPETLLNLYQSWFRHKPCDWY